MNQSMHLESPFNSEAVNRINGLPDKLLCHTLAFLPTRCAVATSILSKRWMYVWKDLPALDFRDLPSSMKKSDIVFDERQYISFRNFVNKILLLNGSPCLQRVHLEVYKGVSPTHAYEWMLVIARRCVVEFCVIAKHSSIELPSNFLLEKEKLTALKLEGQLKLNLSASIHLPSLESLSLSRVMFLDKNDPLSSILSSSTVLKAVNIDTCEGLEKLSVSSSSLKILRIIRGKERVLIETPNLEVLHLSVGHGRNLRFAVNDLPSLVEARIDDIRTSSVRWIKLLQRICHTKTLVLSSILVDSNNFSNQLRIFEKLTRLEVGNTPWSIVLQILRHAPYLQSLIIHKLMYDWPDIKKMKRNELYLERIEYYGFDVEVGFEVVKYFLSNSLLLKQLKIFTRSWLDPMAENEILKMMFVGIHRCG